MKRLMMLLGLLVMFASIGYAETPENIYDKTVTCTFKDQGFQEIVTDLAKQANVEILVDPTLAGKLTVDFGQVNLRQALEKLCLLINAYPGRIGDKLVIASADPKGPFFWAIMETEVVRVGYVEVRDLMLYFAKNPIAQYLTANETTNSISITAPRPIIDYATALIREHDQRQPQLRIEGIAIDDSSIQDKDKGVQFQFAFGPPNPKGVVNQISFANTIVGWLDARNGQKLMNFSSWEAQDKLKILAQPSVVVQNGKTANINFGRNFYIPIIPATGGSPTNIQQIKTGVSLKVTPRVVLDTSGKPTDIMVDVNASVDDVVSTSTAGNIPVSTNSRTATTTLCVKPGETIIIGGLATSQEYWIKSKTPFLGDIPLLGNLFRASHKEFRQQKVTILITATVVEPEKAAVEAKPAKEEIKERMPSIGVPTPPVESLTK